MDYKLHTLTNKELKELSNLIDTEIFNRQKEKEKELTEAFEKAWKAVEDAGLDIYCFDDIPIHFDNIYFD